MSNVTVISKLRIATVEPVDHAKFCVGLFCYSLQEWKELYFVIFCVYMYIRYVRKCLAAVSCFHG